ncbi:MAG: hypothetical protein U9M94_03115 [Patescibacteria group bacterium]|nr:hypothetical protein [Patescibacteria group bacterium]
MLNKKNTIFLINCSLAIIFIIVLFVLLFSKNNIDKKAKNDTKFLQEYLPAETNKNIPLLEKENDKIYDAVFEENFKNIVKQTAKQETQINKDLYPILDLIGYNADEIKEKIKIFKNNGMDFGTNKKLMSEIMAKFGNKLDDETLGQIKENHIIFLCITNELHKNYFSRDDISFMEYKNALSSLFILEQKIYKENLTNEEYEDFFDMTKEETNETIAGLVEIAPEFEYYNSDATAEEIYEKIPRWKLERIIEFSKTQSLMELEIGEQVNTGELTIDEAIKHTENSFKIYLESAKEILDKEEFHLMFASVENQF